jgi:hypothetical protein
MPSGGRSASYDRVAERQRAVALARHSRKEEGLSIAQTAERLGRSPATIKAYFFDPTGEKARAVKARYVGVCRGCRAYTQPRNDKSDAYAYCKVCHPGAVERRWTRERVLDAMRAGARSTGGCRPPTTGRAHTRVVAGERRSRERGRPLASSAASSDRERRPERRRPPSRQMVHRGSSVLALYLAHMGVEHDQTGLAPRCELTGPITGSRHDTRRRSPRACAVQQEGGGGDRLSGRQTGASALLHAEGPGRIPVDQRAHRTRHAEQAGPAALPPRAQAQLRAGARTIG